MAAFRLVHITFAFAGVPKILDLEPIFNSFTPDWIRYTYNGWILWTDKATPEIYSHLDDHLDRADNLLITAINVDDSFGRLPKWVWDWIKSKNAGVAYGDEIMRYLEAAGFPKLNKP